ncbi:hypothetical protein HK097_001031 [Rhizophlyctis rosea]|uniref:Ankyrin n=1 Tax=Rhizophlyctis rosea TaxID=64517 RepID=A0AAD5SJY3_9FUNG|nr:hypothetical protein HK097_001031 [Rhizophlyctis rosea]
MSRINPIHLAIANPSLPILHLLLSNPQHLSLINEPDVNNDEFTPLHHAVAENLPEFVSVLVANGADVRAVDAEGRTPLLIAAQGDFAGCANALVDGIREQGGEDLLKEVVGICGKDGVDSLGHAVVSGSIAVVEILLSAGLDGGMKRVESSKHTNIARPATHNVSVSIRPETRTIWTQTDSYIVPPSSDTSIPAHVHTAATKSVKANNNTTRPLASVSATDLFGALRSLRNITKTRPSNIPPPPPQPPVLSFDDSVLVTKAVKGSDLKRRHTILHPMSTSPSTMDSLIKELEGVLKSRKSKSQPKVEVASDDDSAPAVAALAAEPATSSLAASPSSDVVLVTVDRSEVEVVVKQPAVDGVEVEWECL